MDWAGVENKRNISPFSMCTFTEQEGEGLVLLGHVGYAGFGTADRRAENKNEKEYFNLPCCLAPL